MPKVKTRKAVSKRFKLTKTGKVKRRQTKLRHLMTCKSRNKKRSLRQGMITCESDARNVRKMMPYG